MSTLDQLTGNADRSNAIRLVMAQGPLSFADAAMKCDQFAPNFDFSEDEYKAAMAEQPATEVQAEPAAEVSQENVTAEPTMTGEQIAVRIRELGDALHGARAVVMDLERERRLVTRPKLAAAILAWQTGGQKPPTFENLVRDTLASSAIERLARSQGKLPAAPYRGGPSAIDKSRGHDGGIGAADRFTRRRMGRGASRFRTGDTIDARGRITAPAPKLPSER
jgi:hypothetical protein